MGLIIAENILSFYQDVLTPEVLDALNVLASLNAEQKRLMDNRNQRRLSRAHNKEKISFLDPDTNIPGTTISVRQARQGHFEGSPIPTDLQRQWIQGTGPAARPNVTLKESLRNVAYALLSGANGWMFDGEDALGQISTMSLDNQRNLKLAFHRESIFIDVAQEVTDSINQWAIALTGKERITDTEAQLKFTTKIFRPRGLHLDDRHIQDDTGAMLSASIVDVTLYVVNNFAALQKEKASIVLYLPKIQTAEEAAFWNQMLSTLEAHLMLEQGTIKTYVLVEQLEASFQLMEIRAALGKHFVGFNTGRWDYINSVADAMAWDETFVNPNIEAITMTYGYMKHYEDRVRRAVNTPDINGHCALWQGGMEANIPVGSSIGVNNSMKNAIAGAWREQQAGASGKWVAHWKMVPIVSNVWEEIGENNQTGRIFPPLTYTETDAENLLALKPGPRTIRGVRNLISVALQYGNAFCQGRQAVALKPADFFDNDEVLYLMEDMATGEIRTSILWEWLHKKALFTEHDPETNIEIGDIFTQKLFIRLLNEEYNKLLNAKDKDVHDHSKTTSLPIAKAIVKAYVLSDTKMPWYIDLLNLNLNNLDLPLAMARIQQYRTAFKKQGIRLTGNPDLIPIEDQAPSSFYFFTPSSPEATSPNTSQSMSLEDLQS